MANDNKPTPRQRAQDSMYDQVTNHGTRSASDAYLEIRKISTDIDLASGYGKASVQISAHFGRIPDTCSPFDICSAFADLEQELYEAKESELMKGY